MIDTHTHVKRVARLEGKVAIITGAGAGIGRCAALKFAQEGARVAIAERSDEAGKETEAMVQEMGGEALFVSTDVTVEQSVASMVQTVIDRFGQLDVLYNNCGGSSAADGRVHEVPIEEWWRTIGVDLFGTFLVSRSAVPHMLERGGSIINTTSAAALVGITGGRSSYSAAKGGIISLTRAMAASYHENAIRVNAIAPGGTATERIRSALSARGAMPDLDTPGIPSLCQPEDIANAAVFLASNEARMITGVVLPVDGGSTSTRRLNR